MRRPEIEVADAERQGPAPSAETEALCARTARSALGLTELRPGQLEAMAALAEGRDTLAVMPTGSGKSAIYQVPALLLPGPTLVVSPLIALQRDQVRALRAHDEEARSVDAGTSAREREATFQALRAGTAEFLFCAPEQLARPDVVKELAAAAPSLMVVDEAHCVSTWGHDFRPDYLRLGAVADAIGRPAIVALTATAAPPVRAEIVERLGMRDPVTIVRGFDRPNISLEARWVHGDATDEVTAAVREQPQPGIVYVATRKRTGQLARVLGEAGLRAAPYHAGLPRAERHEVHERFLKGDLDVVVATNAFGMGIDKPDVRYVFHAEVPGSLDAYYQEIGRAGRDGGPARAVLFYRPEDLGLQRFFTGSVPDAGTLERVAEAVADGTGERRRLAERAGVSPRRLTLLLDLLRRVGAVRVGSRAITPVAGGPDPATAADLARGLAERRRDIERTRLEMMRRYAETGDCRRRLLLGYFGEHLPSPCGDCDTCHAGTAMEPAPGEGPFPVHTHVEHATWGPGQVIRRDDDRLIVLFEEAGYRELLLEAVLEHDLLRETGPGSTGT
ncbi:RecQ family ATP-dependent DNA helicase [Sphaerisporangium rubeum]|uniref:ATP-dependent DNA helicase RecQ n=1 Tax=Sphaerisporangium rubeum TaxID=321317 RepID=A0A7X0IFD3_9ACTN|nr:ATP-dependent DNA helicase RecQ [Sphaerisporangium rubeum]MBB6474191.1 ATP-dependent DNA helicase RecQ [Sphaerisporangium rubeum]